MIPSATEAAARRRQAVCSLPRHADRARPLIGQPRQPVDLIQRHASLRCSTCDLVHDQISCYAAAQVGLGRCSGGDVVADYDRPAVDPLGAQALLRPVEVQPVTGIVAVAEQDACAGVERAASARPVR